MLSTRVFLGKRKSPEEDPIDADASAYSLSSLEEAMHNIHVDQQPHKFFSGTPASREIRKYQLSTNLLLRKLPFAGSDC